MVEKLQEITELLNNREASRTEIGTAVGSLFNLLFELRASSKDILAETEKVIEKLDSFQKNRLPLDSLIYSINDLIKLISKSEKNKKQNSDLISFITSIRGMTDNEIDELINNLNND